MKVSTFASIGAECCCRVCVVSSLQRRLPCGCCGFCSVGVFDLPP